MERFHMTDVISLLGIQYPPAGRSAYYVQCPCCDDKPRDKHLNINLKKEVLRCPKCGVHGGIFDLYALYTGTPRDEVRKALVNRLGLPEQIQRPKRVVKPAPEIQECPITDIETRHATYSALLSNLSLAPDHHDNVQNGYKSLLALLDEMGFRYGTYIWDPRYKGLDDYIWSLYRNQNPSAGA